MSKNNENSGAFHVYMMISIVILNVVVIYAMLGVL